MLKILRVEKEFATGIYMAYVTVLMIACDSKGDINT